MKNIYAIILVLTCLSIIEANAYAGGVPPVAGYSYYVEFIGAGSEVSFLNESTDGVTYFWDFGDGGTSTDLNPVHAYPEPGIFIVCLTTTNPYGSDTFCDTINTYYAPFADFSFSGDPDVIFTDLTTNYPTTWVWFFGDGDTTTIENPTHTYLSNGDFTVCLSAGNPGGTSYTCKTVSISSYPVTVAAFSYAGDPTVNFTDLSSDAPFAWSWDFGDGNTSSIQNPVNTYIDNGTFNVCLTATNAGGTNTHCEDVIISNAIPLPVADFTYLAIGLGVAFIDASTNTPDSWYWDFGDGTNSTEQNPVHEYPDAGSYNACLTATNGGGSDTKCEDLFIESDINTYTIQHAIVFPNPASAMIVMNFAPELKNGTLRLISSTGEIVLQKDNITGKSLEINCDELPAGLYFYIVREGNEPFATGSYVIK